MQSYMQWRIQEYYWRFLLARICARACLVRAVRRSVLCKVTGLPAPIQILANIYLTRYVDCFEPLRGLAERHVISSVA